MLSHSIHECRIHRYPIIGRKINYDQVRQLLLSFKELDIGGEIVH